MILSSDFQFFHYKIVCRLNCHLKLAAMYFIISFIKIIHVLKIEKELQKENKTPEWRGNTPVYGVIMGISTAVKGMVFR